MLPENNAALIWAKLLALAVIIGAVLALPVLRWDVDITVDSVRVRLSAETENVRFRTVLSVSERGGAGGAGGGFGHPLSFSRIAA